MGRTLEEERGGLGGESPLVHLSPLSSPFLLSVIINLLPAECWRSSSGVGPLHTSSPRTPVEICTGWSALGLRSALRTGDPIDPEPCGGPACRCHRQARTEVGRSGEQRASLGRWSTSGLGDDSAGRKMGEPLAKAGWPKRPLEETLDSGWQSLGVSECSATPSSPGLPWPGKQGFH